MSFPSQRPRRMRLNERLRDFARDVTLQPADFVLPIFVKSGIRESVPVNSMPGVYQFTVEDAVAKIRIQSEKGYRQFMLFGVVDALHKDPDGSVASSEASPVVQLIEEVRRQKIDALLIADLCFCEYTDHGHCGALSANPDETVANDQTNELLGGQAVALANAGADMVAPSGMMDGMVQAIRRSLDASGSVNMPIMSYATKYASNFYGPFRDAGEGAPSFGSRKSYQMDFARTDEWRREIELDLAEGADSLLVKPAMSYLDVLHQVAVQSTVPVGAYHVSGEYSMLHAASEKGYVELRSATLEQLTAIKRAGAGFIVTYFADVLYKWLR